jgi:hypothetical protein
MPVQSTCILENSEYPGLFQLYELLMSLHGVMYIHFRQFDQKAKPAWRQKVSADLGCRQIQRDRPLSIRVELSCTSERSIASRQEISDHLFPKLW